MGQRAKMDYGWLVIPITFLAGFVLGKKLHGTVGVTVSAVVGALAYVSGLVILISPSAVFSFNIPTQLLIITFGALVSIFGWFIVENYKLLIRQKSERKTN
jgi:hypothetical protein